MRTLVGLLRAVNVGGTRVLPMADLVRLGESCGFTDVRTYIQSGNLIFRTAKSAVQAGRSLERALEAFMGSPVEVTVRDQAELAELVRLNPFRGAPPAKVVIFFAARPLAPADFDGLTGPGGESVVVRGRHLYVHYPDGQGRSKLKLPRTLGAATARNLNTVAKLSELCAS